MVQLDWHTLLLDALVVAWFVEFAFELSFGELYV